MTMLAVRLLIWTIALGFTALFLFGCSPSTPRAVVTYPPDGEWVQRVMSSGPSIYHTCINGDRIYALQPLASRASAGLWPGASIAVAAGGCR